MGNSTYSAFKGADTIGELTLSTATGNGEIGLQTPTTSIVSSLDGGDKWCIGHTFEFLGSGTVVIHAQGKVGVGGENGTGLECHLPVHREMEALVHEDHTCGVAVYTVNPDNTVTCHITVESEVLVGVCKNAACPNVAGDCHHEYDADKF